MSTVEPIIDNEFSYDEIILSELKSREQSNKYINATASYDIDNFPVINKVTSGYLTLMMDIVKYPTLRKYFSKEIYKVKDSNGNSICPTQRWIVETTEYSRHFLTEGLVVYDIFNENSKEPIRQVVIPFEKCKLRSENTKLLKQLKEVPGNSVKVAVRNSGAGMKIPMQEGSIPFEFKLNQNILWPVMIITYNDGATSVIKNFAGGLMWTTPDSDSDGKVVISENMEEQGQTKAVLNIRDVDNIKSVELSMPYICAEFDVLTEITFDSGSAVKHDGLHEIKIDEESVILYTT